LSISARLFPVSSLFGQFGRDGQAFENDRALVVVHLGKLAASQSSRKPADADQGGKSPNFGQQADSLLYLAVRLLTIQNRYVTTANGINY